MNDLRSSKHRKLFEQKIQQQERRKMWVHCEHENTIGTGLMFKRENCKELEENSRTSCVS